MPKVARFILLTAILLVVLSSLAFNSMDVERFANKETEDQVTFVQRGNEIKPVIARVPTEQQMRKHRLSPQSELTITDVIIKLNGIRTDIGDITASLSGQYVMEATFTVDPEFQSWLCDCISFHWVQIVDLDHCAEDHTYEGDAIDTPKVDPPSGGWDYMYNDGSTRNDPNMGIPNYGWFIDEEPWYLNAAGEEVFYDICKTFLTADAPAPCRVPPHPPGSTISFKTWLVAESGSEIFCLIAGFTWAISEDHIIGPGDLGQPTAAHATEVANALTNGHIDDWTVEEECDLIPTAVTLSSFNAIVSDHYINVNWETASELDNAGFNLYRRIEWDEGFVKLNENLIPALGSTIEGASYSYTDYEVIAGNTYYYILENVSLDGNSTMSDPISVTLGVTSMVEDPSALIPDASGLSQNYPNPFNVETDVRYQIPDISFVTLKVYNILGQEIVTLEEGTKEAGYQTVHWNGTDSVGQEVPSGVYLYRITAGDWSDTKRMVLLK